MTSTHRMKPNPNLVNKKKQQKQSRQTSPDRDVKASGMAVTMTELRSSKIEPIAIGNG